MVVSLDWFSIVAEAKNKFSCVVSRWRDKMGWSVSIFLEGRHYSEKPANACVIDQVFSLWNFLLSSRICSRVHRSFMGESCLRNLSTSLRHESTQVSTFETPHLTQANADHTFSLGVRHLKVPPSFQSFPSLQCWGKISMRADNYW